MKKIFLLYLCLPLGAFATPGAVDQYDCHRDFETNEYHCHGDDASSKQSHVLIGVAVNSDVWTYVNGPYNVFAGARGVAEFATGFIGVHGGWSSQSHLTGTSDYSTYGWDVGLKLGPDISRIGMHPFVEVGYFSQNFAQPSGAAFTYQGLQYGGGFIWNRPKFAVDIKVLSRDTVDLELIWTQLGAPGVSLNLSAQVGGYLRF
jgi:hypothetical protein